MTLILSFINWTGMARTVRGKFLSLKNEDYVMAARLAGVSTWKIIWKHLVPGFMSYLIVSMTLGIPGSIVGETSMSYLGLGIKSPATSWGVLLQEASSVTNVAANPHKLIPIIFVTITVLAYNAKIYTLYTFLHITSSVTVCATQPILTSKGALDNG